MVEYSQAYTDIYNDNTLSVDEEEAAIASLNEEFGFDPEIGKDEFEDMMTATNFIDTTHLVDFGSRYNVHWGDLNGDVLYERQNKYHKPQQPLD